MHAGTTRKIMAFRGAAFAGLEIENLRAVKLKLENSNEAMRRTKQFLQERSLTELEKDLALASQEFQVAVNTQAARHGLESFRDKRPIVWHEGLEELK